MQHKVYIEQINGKIFLDAENVHQERHDKVKCRAHLNGSEDDGRDAGKRASRVQRRLGSQIYQA